MTLRVVVLQHRITCIS